MLHPSHLTVGPHHLADLDSDQIIVWFHPSTVLHMFIEHRQMKEFFSCLLHTCVAQHMSGSPQFWLSSSTWWVPVQLLYKQHVAKRSVITSMNSFTCTHLICETDALEDLISLQILANIRVILLYHEQKEVKFVSIRLNKARIIHSSISKANKMLPFHKLSQEAS